MGTCVDPSGKNVKMSRYKALALPLVMLCLITETVGAFAACEPTKIVPFVNPAPTGEKDLEKAREFFERAVAAGDTAAQEKYAIALIKGTGFAKDAKRGLILLESAAENSVDAKVELASMLLYGRDVPQNKKRGLKLLEETAAAGNANARSTLANLYMAGDVLPANPAKAVELYRQLSLAGSAAATRRLGILLVEGRGIAPDPKQGMDLLAQAAAKDPSVKALMAGYLLDGKGLAPDRHRAIALLEEADAEGNLTARRMLGILYLEGRYAARDSSKGLSLLYDAAAHGDRSARSALAQALIDGDVICPNPQAGFDILRKPKDLSAEEKIMLGEFLQKGTFGKRDLARAKVLFEQAAVDGDGRGLEDLGAAYLDGEFGPGGVKTGQALLLRAVQLGRRDALAALARAASKGAFGSNSASLYAQYKKRALSLGVEKMAVVDAQRYFWARGVPSKPSKGLALLNAAANAGNSRAALTLVSTYRDGEDRVAAKDLARAESYFEKYSSLFDVSTRQEQRALLNVAAAKTAADFEKILMQDELSGILSAPSLQTNIWLTNRSFALYRMQRVLKAKNFYDGKPDGRSGPATAGAIKKACEAARDFVCDSDLLSSKTAYRLTFRL